MRSIATPLLLAITLVAATVARAEDAPRPGDDGWQPVETSMVQAGESFEAKDLVAVAYGFIWIMVAGFVFTVWRRADRIDRDIASLRAQIERRTGGTRQP